GLPVYPTTPTAVSPALSFRIKVKAPVVFKDSWHDAVHVDSWIKDMQSFLQSQHLGFGNPQPFLLEYDLIQSYLADIPKSFLDGFMDAESWGSTKILHTLCKHYVSIASKDKLMLHWEKLSCDHFSSKKKSIHEIRNKLNSLHHL